jgi:ataxin-7
MTSERSRIPCLSAAAAEGTGKKQQEGTAMATLHRKVPSPEAFLGKPWSSWIDAAKLHCSDSKNPTACTSFYYPVTFPFT